jgi:hypothetical protein
MGKIWDNLTRYAGQWIAVDREGQVLETGDTLADLKARAPLARTFVFACGEAPNGD